MLTVKHIGLHGSESLYQAYEVSFEPHPDAAKTLTRSPIEADHAGGTVTLTKPPMNQGELGRYMLGLVEGTVFVMNETGKTVARYDLGASPVPYKTYSGYDPLTGTVTGKPADFTQ